MSPAIGGITSQSISEEVWNQMAQSSSHTYGMGLLRALSSDSMPGAVHPVDDGVDLSQLERPITHANAGNLLQDSAWSQGSVSKAISSATQVTYDTWMSDDSLMPPPPPTAEPCIMEKPKTDCIPAQAAKSSGPCPHCGFTYQDMTSHIVTCQSAKPHECEICRRRFKRKDHLDRHRISVHYKQRNFSCPICHAAFARLDHCQIHVRQKHKLKISYMKPLDQQKAGSKSSPDKRHGGAGTP